MKRTETLRQAQTCVEEKGARILPVGKISREAMRAGCCPNAGQAVFDRDFATQKTVPLRPPRRLLLVKRPLIGFEGNGLQRRAGDGARTRDSLLGRQELYH